jgi:hypothetical protein
VSATRLIISGTAWAILMGAWWLHDFIQHRRGNKLPLDQYEFNPTQLKAFLFTAAIGGVLVMLLWILLTV